MKTLSAILFIAEKNLLIIGTIRNLPSAPALRSQIIAAAEKYANDLMINQTCCPVYFFNSRHTPTSWK
jgi:hypothetical protein